MGAEHDSWMKDFGIDIGLLQPSAGSGASPAINNPSIAAGDPDLQSALTDTGVALAKGFATGVENTASQIVNSPAAQLVSAEVNPMAPLISRGIDAAVSGDASELAPPDPFTALENADPNDPKQVAQARETVETVKNEGLGLLGFTDPISGVRDAAKVLVDGDPNLVGQGAGRVFVGLVPALVSGGAGLAEGGLVEGGVAEGGAGEAGGVEAAGGEPPQPVSSLDPALRDLPPLPESDPVTGGPKSADDPLRFGKVAPGTPLIEDSPDSLPETQPAPAVQGDPGLEAPPESGPPPAQPFEPPATVRSPPPQFDEPAPPSDAGPAVPLPSSPQGPGFPFGEDPPDLQ